MSMNVKLGQKLHSFDKDSVLWPYSFSLTCCSQAEFMGLFLRAIKQIVSRTLD